jgi:hypothetical protein
MNATEPNKIAALNWSEPRDGMTHCRIKPDVFATVTDHTVYATGFTLVVIHFHLTGSSIVHESWHKSAEEAMDHAGAVMGRVATPESLHLVKVVKENIFGKGWMFVTRDTKGEWRARRPCYLCAGTPNAFSAFTKSGPEPALKRDVTFWQSQ